MTPEPVSSTKHVMKVETQTKPNVNYGSVNQRDAERAMVWKEAARGSQDTKSSDAQGAQPLDQAGSQRVMLLPVPRGLSLSSSFSCSFSKPIWIFSGSSFGSTPSL